MFEIDTNIHLGMHALYEPGKHKGNRLELSTLMNGHIAPVTITINQRILGPAALIWTDTAPSNHLFHFGNLEIILKVPNRFRFSILRCNISDYYKEYNFAEIGHWACAILQLRCIVGYILIDRVNVIIIHNISRHCLKFSPQLSLIMLLLNKLFFLGFLYLLNSFFVIDRCTSYKTAMKFGVQNVCKW